MDICTHIYGMEKKDGTFILHTDSADLLVCFVTDEIVRMYVSFDKNISEESYVLMLTAWQDRLDALFAGDRRRVEAFSPSYTETEKDIRFKSEKVTLVIKKNLLEIRLLSKDGTLLYATLPETPFTHAAGGSVTAYSRMEEDDCYFGFGEKTGLLNKNMSCQRECATDAFAYDAEKADTLYKHIPFYIRLNRTTQKAVGVFYHNFYESVFNMGCERSNYRPRYTYWRAKGGNIDCFLLGGETISRIIDNYTLLTGRPVLLPKRALGYQGSSMYYPEQEKDCDDAVLSFVDTIKAEDFPIDGFHLSSGYTNGNGKRFVFTWNTERFKNPAEYFQAMNARHVQNVPNVKPGVLLCHPRFAEFAAADVFIKDSKSVNENAVGKWWGGDGAFWDFTSPRGRAAWKKYLTENVISVGTDSVWNDNCEYDSLLDEDGRCDFDGKGGTVGALRAVMANLMSKTGVEAVLEHNANARPYIVCRSGCAGIQHYAQTWCGDNITSWKTLKYNISTILGMGLSGQPNEGGDVGGFAGPAPDAELFVRWVQQGIFQPRFSIHSASNDNTVTEPWMFHNVTDMIRNAILLRYRFTPYLYSAEYLAAQTGAPIMRALVFDFQDDPAVYDESFDYMFGRDLLIANVLESGAASREVYLPAGCRWYDWNDNYRCYEGGQTITVPVTLETIPMFVREGAVIAMADNPIYSMEADKTTALHLLVAPKDKVETILYDDDGVSNAYLSGVYRKTVINMQKQGERVMLHFVAEGIGKDTVETVYVEMLAKEKAPYSIYLGEAKLPHFLQRGQFEQRAEGWYYSQTKRAVEIRYANPARETILTVSFADFDLIGMG